MSELTEMAGFGRPRRAAIANLGCKVNQAEMDAVERLLRGNGVEVVGAHEPADLVVVNTCTVTAIADRKSRQAIRRARRANPRAQIIVTGCTVAVDADSLAAVDPAALLYDNDSKMALLAELDALLELPEGGLLPTLSGVGPASPEHERDDAEGSVEDDFEGGDIDRPRAFIKIQDGCSFHCTYCIIPRARGRERSVPAETVLEDVRRALAAGHREVVLTGINAGTYFYAGLDLAGLVRRLLAETPVERIRLSSIEPQHVTDELLSVWVSSGGRCLPHFHVPLQSGDDRILRRMGRRYDTAFYAGVVAAVRRAIPGAAVHADLIAGFPAEDDESWSRTMAFVRGLDLAGIHVFRYSVRPGTPAARMIGQVDGRAKKVRSAEALTLAAESRKRFAAAQLGRWLEVLFERQLADGRWLGHAENYVSVACSCAEPLDNRIAVVRAESVDSDIPDRVRARLVQFVDLREGLAKSRR